MASRSINIYSPLVRPRRTIAHQSSSMIAHWQHKAGSFGTHRSLVSCCAAQESPTATVTDEKEAVPANPPPPPAAAVESSSTTDADMKGAKTAAAAGVKKAVPAKPKKAPVKPLPQMMEEDIIPSLKATLEAQEDLSQIELSFQDNRLEGSFIKNDIPYYFWAFFPAGDLSGPKGFSLSSHGREASTVEPFLIDEKKITDKYVVFWVEKRLAAQGILPVWKEE